MHGLWHGKSTITITREGKLKSLNKTFEYSKRLLNSTMVQNGSEYFDLIKNLHQEQTKRYEKLPEIKKTNCIYNQHTIVPESNRHVQE